MGTDDGRRSRSHRLPDYSSQKIFRRCREGGREGGRASIVLGRFFPGLPFSPFFLPSFFQILPFLFSPILLLLLSPSLFLSLFLSEFDFSERGMWCPPPPPPPSYACCSRRRRRHHRRRAERRCQMFRLFSLPSLSSPLRLSGSQSMPRRRRRATDATQLRHTQTLVTSSWGNVRFGLIWYSVPWHFLHCL